jgi:hypothetical protein
VEDLDEEGREKYCYEVKSQLKQIAILDGLDI